MANLKDIRRRIASVKNTQQITKAMKLVAAAKLRKAQEAVEASRPYSGKMMELMENLTARSQPEAHPLLRRREVKNILIITFAGDKGLCGPFNSSILKAAQKLIADNEGMGITLFPVGKKASAFFGRRKTLETLDGVTDFGNRISYELAEKIADVVIDNFVSEKVDVVYMIFNQFKNVVVQETRTIPALPVELPDKEKDELDPLMVEYKFEPSAEDILDGLLKRYVASQIYRALLESSASEHGARMTAMDAATKNAKEMISDLTLEYNRARQAAITTELIEVVTGADALEN